jgi:radical SAM protein with 4Fe4S-binding SPASM domain
MDTVEIKRILDESADAGCLWLLLTGGEVLLRDDFPEIYLHAVRKGMLVEVFTNATLIDDADAGLFAEFPPLGVDISIYGPGPALHDSVTGISGSFARTMEGIGRLRENRVKFSLKTVLMTVNFGQLEAMRALAAGLGARFRFDTIVCPRTDGGLQPAALRLSPELMAEVDYREDPEALERIFSGFWNRKPEEALTCGAGVFAFNINPYGVLSPCTMFRSFQYPLRGKPFRKTWEAIAGDHEARREELTPAECRSCSMLLICSNCPAWSEIEAKSMSSKVEYVCDYAKRLERRFLERQPNKEAVP